MENMEENSDKIWTIWKKGKLNSEKIYEGKSEKCLSVLKSYRKTSVSII
jgi:hypothetical protein